MERNNQQENPKQNGRAGTGSAEGTGRSREEQQNNMTHLSGEERQDIENSLGNDKNRLSSLEELGSLSGRDDNAGGSGDDMSGQSTGTPTDR